MTPTNGLALLLTLTLAAPAPALALCAKWKAVKTAELDTTVVNEASGLAKATLRPETLLWVNDSGSAEAIHASDLRGQVKRTVSLAEFPNRDTEALAVAPCPRAAESCVYVADIGDNKERRTDYKIGVFREADFWSRTTLSPIEVIRFQYPVGSFNAESFVVLPDQSMVIFSKTKSGVAQIFRIDAAGRVTKFGELAIGAMTAASGERALITDAALSPNGSRVLILTYGDLVEVKLDALLGGGPLRKDRDYSVIPGPGLEQAETVTYHDERTFLVSTEVESGGVADVVTYSCLPALRK
jgi:hypothetical protein